MAISSLLSFVFIELSIILEPILTIRPAIKVSSTLRDSDIFLTPVASDIAVSTLFYWSLSNLDDEVTSACTSPFVLETKDKNTSWICLR